MHSEKIWISKKGFDLFPLSGDPLPVTAVELVGLRPEDTEDTASIAELRLLFRIPPSAYTGRVEPEALFGLKSTARGPIFGGTFHDAPDLIVTARLRADLLDDAKADTDILMEIAARALMSRSELRKTTSWLALTVLQPRDGIQVGMTSTYAE